MKELIKGVLQNVRISGTGFEKERLLGNCLVSALVKVLVFGMSNKET